MAFEGLDDGRAARTAEAFAVPVAGQRFTEMYAYWMYVVKVDGARVWTMEANPPCQLPRDGKVREYATADEYRARFAYETILGYWCDFVDDGNNVEGWVGESA